MRTALSLALAFVVGGAACGGSRALPTPSESPPSVVTATATASASPTSAATATPATAPFLRTALTEVRTGEQFTLGGFTGRTVIVQGMAVW